MFFLEINLNYLMFYNCDDVPSRTPFSLVLISRLLSNLTNNYLEHFEIILGKTYTNIKKLAWISSVSPLKPLTSSPFTCEG